MTLKDDLFKGAVTFTLSPPAGEPAPPEDHLNTWMRTEHQLTIGEQLRSGTFLQMLRLLRENQIAHITFGDPAERFYDCCRIRCINTPGGRQYAIKETDASGREGSGMYFTMENDAMLCDALLLRCSKYLERNPRLTKILNEMRPDRRKHTFCFFAQ